MTDLERILAYFHQHWFLALLIIASAYYIIHAMVRTPFLIVNRICRNRSIAKHGWPPEHCDADGDFKS